MSTYGVITILHAIGAAIGVFGATAADALFLRSIRNRRVSTDQKQPARPSTRSKSARRLRVTSRTPRLPVDRQAVGVRSAQADG
jgi:hypothetical protein